ncbi:MAG: dihydroorotate dehydrogenase (quinone) [Helicobacteraceae bacterium]|nr:dihydroorotate dehydrogenase (quinone) [Helicobacteraceae bacterium]
MFDYSALRNLLFKLPPETAHSLAELCLRGAAQTPFLLAAIAKRLASRDPSLKQTLCGLTFNNPIGIAAGFDKNATMIKPLAALGFGFVEVGTLTPKPQLGAAKPRLWRHIEQKSLQNAMGFNNDGLEAAIRRVEKIAPFVIPIGVNLGKNKTTLNKEAIDDYRVGVARAEATADYLVFNLSSPNTPDLRDLQNESFVRELFVMARSITQKPIFLKIAPDLPVGDAIKVSAGAIESGASGIIAANTTNDYSRIEGSDKNGGGLSGAVLTDKSREFFKPIAKELFGKTTLIASGGIMSVGEAWARIKAGASLAQIYTGLIYEGAGFVKTINDGVSAAMKSEGFNSIGEAIGSDIR